MSPKTARNLALVAAVTLYQPCRNLLAFLDGLCRILFLAPAPHMQLLESILAKHGPWAYLWFGFLMCLLLPCLLAFLLHRYLLRRDFAQVCADCATRKTRLTVLFVLFALFSIYLFHPIEYKIPAASGPCPPPESIDCIETIDDIESIEFAAPPALF